MGIAIQCVLEQPIVGLPEMDGKLLCAAFCSDPGGGNADEDIGPADNLVAIDFGGPNLCEANGSDGETDSLFGPLGQFVTGDAGIDWHEPAEGLAVVRAILEKLRSGATLTIDPEFTFFGHDGEDELTEEVIDDLEALEGILTAAERQHTRFRLVIDA
jgi:hypothetical protein